MANASKALRVEGKLFDVHQDRHIVTGQAADILQATVRPGSAVTLGRSRAESADVIKLSDPDDVVEMVLEDNLLLYTSVHRLSNDIIPRSQRGMGDEVILPNRLSFTNRRTRGDDGLLVSSLKVLDLVPGNPADAVAAIGGELTARMIAAKIEDKLVGPDILYRIIPADDQSEDAVALTPVTSADIDTSQPVLLFIHGTASSTLGSFSKLWGQAGSNTSEVWQELQDTYKENIYALEHRSLTHSPIDNVVDLMEILPSGCRLHIVSHSRGGLAAELLCRAQFNNGRLPFTDDDIALFDVEKLSLLEKLTAETQKDYRDHQQQLKKLNRLLLEKLPVVEKFVRVACPARGTTLAGGKLDVYLSGILNIIGLIPALKASVVYDLIKALTLAVARERTDPKTLPGLEVQMPGSPFIAMLNSAPQSVRAHLAVIKGDIEPTGIIKKISMFFLDRFYESDHDLVVNTPSMDGGARRQSRIPVLFDQGRDINHFSYFANSRTRKGVLSGLTDPHLPPAGFTLESQKAVEIARTIPGGTKENETPSVFILPGLSNSHLASNGKRIWIDFFSLALGKFSDLDIKKQNVTAQSIVPKGYNDLIDYMERSHTVIPFAYDWRRSILDSGLELGAAIDKQLLNSQHPVRIIAHSMGGLVARAMICQCPKIWDRMRDRKGSRLLMLGTPNRGSYSIPRLLARQDRLIKLLALADLRHSQNELLEIIRRFPGILELLPVDEDGKIAIKDKVWDQFTDALPGRWKRPFKKDLKSAQNTWDILSKKVLEPEMVLYIAGQADETPASVTVVEDGKGDREICFTSTEDGDGQVTWESGVPDNIQHWYVNAVHGDIPAHRPAFPAFLEILNTGSTNLLASQKPGARAAMARGVILPDTADIFPSEDSIMAAALGTDDRRSSKKPTSMPVLEARVVHGNLCFARSPIAVGHYRGDTIVSAEAVIDRLLDGRLSKRQQSDVYPGPLLSNDILFNTPDQNFPGAIVLGLGDVGGLTPGGLTESFCKAVIRYVLLGKDTDQFKGKSIELTTLLIGTGAGGLTVRDSVASLLRGVIQANQILAGPTKNYDYIVSKMDIIDLYQDVAIAAQHALVQATGNVEFAKAVNRQDRICLGNGGRTRPYFNEDYEWWQRLRIEVTRDGGLKYTALADQARADMRIQAVQRQSIEPFLKELTDHISAVNDAGRVLYELLVPPEYKNHAAENRRLMLVLDKGAASYPWELLEYGGRDGNEALAIKSGMIRQLSTHYATPADVCTDLNALVVGDPFSGDKSAFTQLPGAQQEARVVDAVLRENRVEVEELMIKSSGARILTKLMTGKYGILHLAGHGVVDFDRLLARKKADDNEKTGQPELVTGMVIGEDQYLTPIEIRQMSHTPSFVFLNCCHLGSITDSPHRQKRYTLAASLATQLIEQGVKAVIAAGWAVDDAAALTFAERFYELFFNGASFGDAVTEARVTTHDRHPRVNTWGAYQCYGDPGFRITPPQNHGASIAQSFVSLAEYVAAVQNIAKDAITASYDGAELLIEKLRGIVKNIPSEYGKDAELLSVTGDAWGELDNFPEAIDCYTKALHAQQGNAPLRCAEQLANFKCRMAVDLARDGEKKKALDLIDEARGTITSLNHDFDNTVERLALLGSAYKRQAEIESDSKTRLIKNLQHMYDFYQDSHKRNLELTGKVNSYPLINFLTAEWLLHLAGEKKYNLKNFDTLAEHAEQANMVPEINQEYFWKNIALTDLNLLTALVEMDLDQDTSKSIAESYIKIGKVASSARQMRSVEEHVSFLCVIGAKLGYKKIDNLRSIESFLKRMR